MKLILQIVPLLLVAAGAVHSQNEPSPVNGEISLAPIPVQSSARIIGTIPDGTPPPPSPPKPEYVIRQQEVLNTKAHQQGGRTVTIRQIKPIDLPPPPAPAHLSEGEADAEFGRRVAEYRAEHPRTLLAFLGVTVFRSKDSPPRSLVRWWIAGNRKSVTFWSSADFALIAGGIQSFEDTSGQTHHLMMGWGNVDIDRMSELYSSAGRKYNAPEMPNFPEGRAIFEIEGDQPETEDLVIIQSLHDIYNNEFAQLRTAFEGRERARIEQEAYLKANPPRPQDITLNYWRTEKPATSKNGGATR